MKRSAGIVLFRYRPGGDVEGDLEMTTIVSNTFDLEWPPTSRLIQAFSEIDRAALFDLATAADKIIVGQRLFLERLPISI